LSAAIRRVAVFIDYQNCYKSSRRAFFTDEDDPPYRGQFWPHMLATLLGSKGGAGYRVTYTGVYAGLPSSKREPVAYAARRRQIARWEKTGVTVVTRPLQYLNWPAESPREKGIDVRLALDIVVKAIRDEYDVGIVASCDTDITPAVEAVMELNGPALEVIAWQGLTAQIRPGGSIVECRWIGKLDFNAMRDPTNYVSDP
jgi:hypothetical protein